MDIASTNVMRIVVSIILPLCYICLLMEKDKCDMIYHSYRYKVEDKSGALKTGDFCIMCVATMFGSLIALFFVVELLLHADAASIDAGIKGLAVFSNENSSSALFTRKLLQANDDISGNRIGTACSKDDIKIFQGSTAPLPNGIPAFSVQIVNVCVSGCSIADIHVSCGWFSSVRLVNPKVFRRVNYNDCIVNDGKPLGPGEMLSFQYANSFRYPLFVSSAVCS